MRATGPDVLQSANIFLEAQDPPQGVFEKRTVKKDSSIDLFIFNLDYIIDLLLFRIW